MKNIVFSTILLTIIAAILSSCNESSNNSAHHQDKDLSVTSENQTALPTDSFPGPPSPGDANAKQRESEKGLAENKDFSMAPIVKDYLALKNALAVDDDKAAARAGKQLFTTLANVDRKSVPANQQKDYIEIAENAKENAEHISDNSGNIDHQREHLASLSHDIHDLIALLGAPQKLYQGKCPMYNGKKGAIWISETKEIRNPYYGNQMLTCGSIEKEY